MATKKKKGIEKIWLGVQLEASMMKEIDRAAEEMRGDNPTTNRSHTVRALLRDALNLRQLQRARRAS